MRIGTKIGLLYMHIGIILGYPLLTFPLGALFFKFRAYYSRYPWLWFFEFPYIFNPYFFFLPTYPWGPYIGSLLDMLLLWLTPIVIGTILVFIINKIEEVRK